MTESEHIGDVLNRWQNGDDQAAKLLVDRYSRRLIVLAEKHLSKKLATRVDAEDIVQSVFHTFFRRAARGDFHIDNSVSFWQLLVSITLTKVRMQARHHRAAKRDIGAETERGMDAWLPEAIANKPSPSEAAVLVDLIESLLEGLPEKYCEILSWHLEGYSRTEIAGKLNISRQTVCRAVSLIQERANRVLSKETPESMEN